MERNEGESVRTQTRNECRHSGLTVRKSPGCSAGLLEEPQLYPRGDHQKDRSRQFKQLLGGEKEKERKNRRKGEKQARENPKETLAQKPF